MSLSLDLKRIKSSGLYRFVYDKSTLPPSEADIMRLFVGYSNKGPFNTPVYIDNIADFQAHFGKASKKLEKKGIFFHRLCEESIPVAPIFALNIKPFGDDEKVEYASFDFENVSDSAGISGSINSKPVKDIYNTSRFWYLDPDQLPSKIGGGAKYFSISATDTKETSCSIFFRKAPESATKGYNLTFREWYAGTGEEIPEYVEAHLMDEKVSDYFVEAYVFKGEFTESLCGENGILKDYFTVDSSEDITLKTDYKDAFGDSADALYALAGDRNSNYIAGYVGCTLPYFKDAMGSYVSIDLLINNDYSAHKLIAKLDDSKLDASTKEEFLKIVKPDYGETAGLTDTPEIGPVYLEGYTYDVAKVTTKSIIDFLSDADARGIREALTNHVDSEWRYLVDTFLIPAGGDHANKKTFAALVKEKDNALAILNTPTMDSLLDKASGDVEKIPGNFPLPTDTNGASWVAYYTPYVVSDGTVKTVVPSAGAISNLFMEKYTTRLPYNVVAGPTFGRIVAEGLVGPDHNYSRKDLDVLEPMGINALVYQPRFGTYINSNQTAKQTPVSALSKVHVRELVIYLQDAIEEMLRGYQWELNTAALRATIKTKADTLLENVLANGGVYDFRCICDESNNTPETIDNEFVILDVHIEPARAAGKMVQRLYIYKTGQISTLGI